MVLGFDDAVGRGAFAGDVAFVWGEKGGLVGLGGFWFWLGGWGRVRVRVGCFGAGRERARRGGGVCVDLQVDEFAFVVFHDCCVGVGLGNVGGGRFCDCNCFDRGLH